ncbi:MAG: hypothetical protein P1Q69_03655 [Candidatus Thorarchaeota archaeon]|nr:hypothetical protein [Candidatus Thorarchaeota archaeon]
MRNIRIITLVAILLTFGLPTILTTPINSQVGTSFTCSIEAQLIDGTLEVQSYFEGPDEIDYEVTSEFVPNRNYILSDSEKFDSDDDSGMSGYFYCSVTGYYVSGYSYFHHEKHYGYVDLVSGHYLGTISLRCEGDNEYDEIKTSLGTYHYYEDIYDDVYTRMTVTVYYLGWYVGTVSLTAHITGP